MLKPILILLSTMMLLQASNAESVTMNKHSMKDSFNKYGHLMHKGSDYRSSDPTTTW